MTTKKYREIAEKLFTENPEKYVEVFGAVKTLVKYGVIEDTWLDYIAALDRRFAIVHFDEVISYIDGVIKGVLDNE